MAFLEGQDFLSMKVSSFKVFTKSSKQGEEEEAAAAICNGTGEAELEVRGSGLETKERISRMETKVYQR